MVYIVLLLCIFFAGRYFYIEQKNEQKQLEQLKQPGIDIFLDDMEISGLYVDGDDMFVGGSDGVYKVNSETGEILETVSDELKLIYTAAIEKTKDDVLWIGHDSGLSAFDGEQWKHFVAPEIPEGRCNTIVVHNNQVWAGLQEGAICIESTTQGTVDGYQVTKTVAQSEGLAENTVNAIAFDPYHNQWFGAYLSDDVGGVSIVNNSKWYYSSIEEGLPHKYVTAIQYIESQKDKKSGVLVGCGHLNRGGLALFTYNQNQEPVLSKTFNKDTGLPGEKIRQLYQDDNGLLWITSEASGVLICNDEGPFTKDRLEGVLLDKRHGLSDNEIKVIDENDQYYWLGGKLGLTRIEKSVIESLMSEYKVERNPD